MKIAVIGAGAAGLVTLKYAIDEGHECDAYEQTEDIGGLWRYREEIEDENGVPIVSPMYKKLRTNLPKETMTFLDFPHVETEKSHITHSQVLEYFRRFANRFELKRHIKFISSVTQLKRLSNEKWGLTFQNIKTKKEEYKEYDAVFICNGHYNVARLPNIPGQEKFQGLQFHSIYFREADKYKHKRVLLVGGGSSALDIGRIVSEVSDCVYISHRSQYFYEPVPGIIKKPAILHLDEDGAVFIDESKECFDVIIYCTGYKYDYPFLTECSGIQVQNNCVKSLYKHIVNIEHPTMFFIGIPSGLCVLPMFDLQARFALALLKQQFCLPTKEAMKEEVEEYMKQIEKDRSATISPHRLMGTNHQLLYFQDLATTARVRPIPIVITKIYECLKSKRDFSQSFKIIDDENFLITN